MALEVEVLLRFREWDCNNDGVIDEAELLEVLTSLGMSHGQVHHMFEKMDINKDMKVDYTEFCKWVFDSGSRAIWEWRNGDSWSEFSEKDMEMLEARYKMGGPKSTFTTTDFTFNKRFNTLYEVNFENMYQKNMETESIRKIRRRHEPRGSALAQWEWCNAECEWSAFAEEDASLLEEAFSSGTSPFRTKDLSFNKRFGTLYIFDFDAMTQVNSVSGVSRKVRRTDSTRLASHSHIVQEAAAKEAAVPGDRVKFNGKNSSGNAPAMGTVGTLLSVGGVKCSVELDDGSTIACYTSEIDKMPKVEQMEAESQEALVHEAAAKEAAVPGDRVKFNGQNLSGNAPAIGTVGTLLDSGPVKCCVELDDGSIVDCYCIEIDKMP